jgi:hypothetical protein
MSDVEKLQPDGEKIRRAVSWISETVKTSPHRKRLDILREAQIRFDLSPRESEFVESRLGDDWQNAGQ